MNGWINEWVKIVWMNEWTSIVKKTSTTPYCTLSQSVAHSLTYSCGLFFHSKTHYCTNLNELVCCICEWYQFHFQLTTAWSQHVYYTNEWMCVVCTRKKHFDKEKRKKSILYRKTKKHEVKTVKHAYKKRWRRREWNELRDLM